MPDSELDSPAHRDARAEARPRVDGAAEERRRAAVREGAGAHRRRGAAGRQQPRAARQLQRLPLALDDGARGHPEAVPEGARRLRAGHDVPPARRAGADVGADHRARAPRASKAEVFEKPDFSGAPVETRTDAAGPRRTRPRRRPAAELRRAAACPGAADALDRLPDASRERHLPPRRRGVGQPPVPRRQASWSTRPAASRRPRASSTSPLEKGRRYAIRIESIPRRFAVDAARVDAAAARRRDPRRRRRPRRGRRRRRRRHHLRPRGRGVRRGSGGLQGRRPHEPRPADARSSGCSRPSRAPASRSSWS